MIEMQEEDRVRFTNQSSKGNQLKFLKNNIWYKSDYTGYEGLAEYVVSEFLKRSTLDSTEYVTYRTEEINYVQLTKFPKATLAAGMFDVML